MFMFSLFGALVVGGLVGFVAEWLGLAANGIVTSVVLGVGGAVIAYVVMGLFGFSLGGRTMTAAIGALAALFLAPRIGRGK